MRIFYDTEFIEDGHTIDLISIAMVAEDGRELYLQSVEYDESKANEWVKANVLPKLKLCPCCKWKENHENGKCRHAECPWRTREQIKQEILAFVGSGPEFWGWYCAYDWVVLCQLFGTMISLPSGWPMWTNDLQQWHHHLDHNHDYPSLSDRPGFALPNDEHSALSDARWVKTSWQKLSTYE